MHDLPLAQGFAFAAWAIENNGLVATERVGRGYLGQELENVRRRNSKTQE